MTNDDRNALCRRIAAAKPDWAGEGSQCRDVGSGATERAWEEQCRE